MVFNVQSGTLEVKVHENEFIVHKDGIWQVPRGTLRFSLLLFAISLFQFLSANYLIPIAPLLRCTLHGIDRDVGYFMCVLVLRVARSCSATLYHTGPRASETRHSRHLQIVASRWGLHAVQHKAT